MSSVVLPQIEDGSNTSDLKITSEEGSWFGNNMVTHHFSFCLYLKTVVHTRNYQYRLFFPASIFVIGSITGALAGGISGEKLGRKSALMIDNLIMIVGKTPICAHENGLSIELKLKYCIPLNMIRAEMKINNHRFIKLSNKNSSTSHFKSIFFFLPCLTNRFAMHCITTQISINVGW